MAIKCIESDNYAQFRRFFTVGVAGGLMALVVLGGCQKTALRADDSRSQFDRYDQARNQSAQPFLEDEFGRRTPNLSERLIIRSE